MIEKYETPDVFLHKVTTVVTKLNSCEPCGQDTNLAENLLENTPANKNGISFLDTLLCNLRYQEVCSTHLYNILSKLYSSLGHEAQIKLHPKQPLCP